jgi:hypothetical protein
VVGRTSNAIAFLQKLWHVYESASIKGMAPPCDQLDLTLLSGNSDFLPSKQPNNQPGISGPNLGIFPNERRSLATDFDG